jgi:hypothetical protein
MIVEVELVKHMLIDSSLGVVDHNLKIINKSKIDFDIKRR